MMILQQTRGALSSGDQCSLDLPFAETKSLAARIGPTPTFTRGSGGSYIGSDGLIHGIDTSTSSVVFGTGSRTFILEATAGQDQMWRSGDAVEASNAAGALMVGTVTSYTPSTQSLVCSMTSGTGTGTFAAWRIAFRGPRFDHDPLTLDCKGLLIEESRTNLVPRSERFDDLAWTPIRLVSQPASNTDISPSGQLTAEKLVPSLSVGDHRIDRASVSGLIVGTVYTVSVFVKASGYTGFGINVSSSPSPYGATFDLATGTVSGTQSGWKASIQPYPNDWYRCVATFTFSSGTRIYFAVGQTGTSFSYAGNETSGILIYGAQAETGAFPTSYIPTITASAVRSADVCSITGGAFNEFYNPLDGTIVAATLALGFSTSNNAICSVDSGTTIIMRIFHRSVQSNRLSSSVSSIQATPAANYNTANAEYKSALAANADGADFVINGTQIPDVFTGSSLSADSLKFSGISASTSNNIISSFRYYKKRLSNAKLQALTL
jgi:hypothetical protein